MHDGRAPVAEIDVTSRAFSLDPGPGYDELRSIAPVLWQPAARGFLLTRFAEIMQAYRDPALIEYDLSEAWRKISSKLGVDYDPALRLFKYMPFIYEGTRHQQLRTAMARAVAPFATSQEIFARCIDRQLSAAGRNGGFDLVEDFVGTLLFEILCEIAEIPEAERAEIRPLARISWALDPTLSAKGRAATVKVLSQCMPPLLARVGKALRQPGSSLIHHIERALPKDEEDKVSATAHLLAVILVMGNDALAGCVSYPVRHMLADDGRERHPRQSEWAAIYDDAIRFSSPVSFSTRVAAGNTALAGCPIRPGDIMVVSPFAADRDPAVFGPDPTRMTPRSKYGPGLAFAAGSHSCVGLRMSRSIVQSVFRSLADLPAMKLSGPGAQGRGRVVRTLVSLPIEFH